MAAGGGRAYRRAMASTAHHHRRLAGPRSGACPRARRRGWGLVIDARGADALEPPAPSSPRTPTSTALAGDVTDPRHRRALVAAAGDRIDLSSTTRAPRPESAAAARRLPARRARARCTRVNVVAPLALVQVALPSHARGARIVNITSDAAVEAYEGWGGYGSSKAALEQLTRCSRRAPAACASTGSTPATCARRCTRRRSPARTSPTARRPRQRARSARLLGRPAERPLPRADIAPRCGA